MEGLGGCALDFDPASACDFLLAPCDSSASASPSASPCASPKRADWPSEARGELALLAVRLPCASPSPRAASEGSGVDAGLSPARTASVSETRSPTRRAAAAAGAARTICASLPGSECSEGGSIKGGEEDSDADGAPCPKGPHSLQCAARSGSRAGTPCLLPAAGAFPEGPPQHACTTPPAFQLNYGNADGPSSGAGGSSRALTPAGLSPAQQLEVLAAKLEAEAEARRAAQRQLAAQRAEAEQQCQALGQQYEARMAALRQELQQAAEQGAGAVLRRGILAGGGC